jgi:DNA-directed RNA polymerase subunit alpha
MAKTWVKYVEESPTYGKFVVEPLDRGYGTTLGNSLRRILLSSLGGAAVVSAKIDGVDHEFSTLPGVKEDMLDIIMNIKGIVVKSYSEDPKELKISAKGEGFITAKDIEHDNEVEIINKNHHIASLGKDGKLNVVLTVQNGIGYRVADITENKKHPIGTIPVDASFSPIVRVNHKVEPTRVGKSIDYDKLTLEVWTNGAITPEDAIKKSAMILKAQMDIFFNLNQKPEEDITEAIIKDEKQSKVLDLTIEDLELSARSLNCLRKANIKNVAELVKMPMEKLLKIKNFGKKSAEEINSKLAQYGLALAGDITELEETPEEDETESE